MATSLLDKLMDEVNCLRCLGKIEPPLRKCTSGHHFCRACNKCPVKCPSCEKPTRRDYLVERLCSTSIRCPFVKDGCDFTGKPAAVAVHKSSNHTTDCGSSEEAKVEVSRKECIDEDSAKSLEDAILAELQCPVCLMRLSPPIAECINGHLICQICLPEMERCPICRNTESASGNVFLDSIFHMLDLPCRNEQEGCEIRGDGSIILEHERTCGYVIISCPLKNNYMCTWIGLQLEVLHHCRTAHHEVLSLGPLRGEVSEANWIQPFDLFYADSVLFRSGWIDKGDYMLFVVNHSAIDSNEEYYPVELTIYSNFWKDGKVSLPLRSVRMNSGNDFDGATSSNAHSYVTVPKDLFQRHGNDCEEFSYDLQVTL